MNRRNYKLSLFATIFAIVFTVLSFMDTQRALMWLSVELIVLPFIYVVGYEMLMSKQRKELVAEMNKTLASLNIVEKQNLELKNQLTTIKKIK